MIFWRSWTSSIAHFAVEIEAVQDQLVRVVAHPGERDASADLPETTGPNAPHEYGVLSRELQRQRGHKPVRQLVNEMGACL